MKHTGSRLRTRHLHATCIMLLCALSACTRHTDPRFDLQKHLPRSTFTLANIPPEDFETQLNLTARSIEQAWKGLAATQQKDPTQGLNTAVLTTPEGGLSARANIDWAGPVPPLLQRVSYLTQYKLSILGTEPALPILISLTGRDVSVADVLKDIGLQISGRAELVVYPERKMIELRYAPA